ncbi:alpha/beta-hydrolase [Dentipellis sp. KUC8613]|nr:alpha/beta-hydrolase [Dentipellis sp. KUC8613]
MFEFRHQPFKGVYWTLVGLSIVVRLPYWSLTWLVPAWRPRRSWGLARTLTVAIVQNVVDGFYRTDMELMKDDPHKNAARADEMGLVWIDGVPDDWITGEVKEVAELNEVVPEKIAGYWYGPRGEDGKAGQPAAPGEKVLYWLHGGAYLGGSISPDTRHRLYENLQDNNGIFPRLFGVEYRVSSAAPFPSANPFPAALLDGLAGYRYLVHTLHFSPDNIVLGGDSAGGHLALSLARYLALAALPGAPQPRGLLLFSPTLDWGCTHDTTPDCSMARNARSDVVAAILKAGYTPRALRGKLPPDAATRNPWISPASLELEHTDDLFAGLPPTCIVAAGAEQTVDAMRTGRDSLVRDLGQGKVRYLEYEDAYHDFLTTSWEPERTQAVKDLVEWYNEIFGTSSA